MFCGKYTGLVAGVVALAVGSVVLCKKLASRSQVVPEGNPLFKNGMYTEGEWTVIELQEKLLKAFGKHGETEFKVDPDGTKWERIASTHWPEDVSVEFVELLGCMAEQTYISCPVEELEKLEEQRRERTQDILVAMTPADLRKHCDSKDFGSDNTKAGRQWLPGYQVCQNLLGQPSAPQHWDGLEGAEKLTEPKQTDPKGTWEVAFRASEAWYKEKQGFNMALMQDAWTLAKRVGGLRIVRPERMAPLNTIATGVRCDVMYSKIAGGNDGSYTVENPALFDRKNEESREAFVRSLVETVVADSEMGWKTEPQSERRKMVKQSVDELLQHLEKHKMGPVNMSGERMDAIFGEKVGSKLGFADFISEPFLGSDHSPISTALRIPVENKEGRMSVKVWQWNVLGWGQTSLAQMTWAVHTGKDKNGKDTSKKYRFQAAIQAEILRAKLQEWKASIDNRVNDMIVLMFQEDLGVVKKEETTSGTAVPLQGFWTKMLEEAGFERANFSSHEGLPASKGQKLASGVDGLNSFQRSVSVCSPADEEACTEHQTTLTEGQDTIVMGNSVYVLKSDRAERFCDNNLQVKGQGFNDRTEIYPQPEVDENFKRGNDSLNLTIPTRSVALGVITCNGQPLLTAASGHIAGGKFDDMKNIRHALKGGEGGKKGIETPVVETDSEGQKYRMVDPTTGLPSNEAKMFLNHKNGGKLVRDMVKLFVDKAESTNAPNVILGLDANAKDPEYMDDFVEKLWTTAMNEHHRLKPATLVQQAQARWKGEAQKFFDQAVEKRLSEASKRAFVKNNFKLMKTGEFIKELLPSGAVSPAIHDVVIAPGNPAFARGDDDAHCGYNGKVVAAHLAERHGVQCDGDKCRFPQAVQDAFKKNTSSRHTPSFGTLASDIPGLGRAKLHTYSRQNDGHQFSVVHVAGLVGEMKKKETERFWTADKRMIPVAGSKIADLDYPAAAKDVLSTAYKNLFAEIATLSGQQRVWMPFVGFADRYRGSLDRWASETVFAQDTVEMWKEAYVSLGEQQKQNLAEKTFIVFDRTMDANDPLTALKKMGIADLTRA